MDILKKVIIIALIAVVAIRCEYNTKTPEDTTQTAKLEKSADSENQLQSDIVVFHKTLSLQNIPLFNMVQASACSCPVAVNFYPKSHERNPHKRTLALSPDYFPIC